MVTRWPRIDDSTQPDPMKEAQTEWAYWAAGYISTLQEKIGKVEDERNRFYADCVTAQGRVEEFKEAVRGMEKAIALRKGVEVYETGQEVLVGGNVRAKVVCAVIEHGKVYYQLSWWSGAFIVRETLSAEDVRSVEEPLKHPLDKGGK